MSHGVVPPRARVSLLRVVALIVTAALMTVGGVVGVQWWNAARAVEGRSPWIAGYVDVTSALPFAFEAPVSDAARDVVLAHIVSAPDDRCEPSWGAEYTLEEASHELDLDRRLARLAELGGQVTVSFGGQENQDLASGCTDHDALVDAYDVVLDRYDVSTIDLDVVGGRVTDTATGKRRAAAIHTLQADRREVGDDLAVWLTLPASTSGLTDDGTTAVAQMLAAGVDLAGINLMTRDFGASLTPGDSLGQASIAALQAAHRQLDGVYAGAGIELTSAALWTRMGVTPMIGQNDLPDEVFGIADAETLNAFARDQHLARMSLWSLNRDKTCGSNYVDLRRVSDSCSGIEQGDIRFVDVLGEGFGPLLSGSADSPEDTAEAVVDDPATSPYPVWAASSSYLEGTKIVWHREVYRAKWWTRGELPDNPVLNAWETSWVLIGPVLPGETPIEAPTLPEGTYPDWAGPVIYDKAERVLFDGVPFESKWWNQGESPEAASANPDGSPWVALTEAEVVAVRDSLRG